MTKGISRRQMLTALGGAVVGGALVSAMPAVAAPTLPMGQVWTPHKLDPVACAPYAHEGYWHNGYGCCYGVFYSIVGTMGEKYGAPYNQFPFHMMEVGKSGISEWGTICGALLGAASAFAMFWGRKERDPMVDELFRWYEKTALPIYNPGADSRVPDAIPTNVAGSVLCHVSVSKWSYETGIDANSKVRSERCGRLTADVAMKAIEIMNAKIDGTFKGAFAKQDSVAYCGDCHGKGKESPLLKGKQDCTPCHSGTDHTQNKFKNHP